MKIKNIMTKKVVTLKADAKVYEAQELMKDSDIGFLPILEGTKIVGILTDKDLINHQREYKKSEESYFDLDISQIMNRSFEYVNQEDEEKVAYEAMKRKGIRRFPVVDDNKNLVGIISINDIDQERINM